MFIAVVVVVRIFCIIFCHLEICYLRSQNFIINLPLSQQNFFVVGLSFSLSVSHSLSLSSLKTKLSMLKHTLSIIHFRDITLVCTL